jgi:hypothetical protein
MFGDFDITKKIKLIEQLKSQLLSDVSTLYSNMIDDKEEYDNIDVIVDMLIISYLLSDQLGISFEALDLKMKNKLKLILLDNTEKYSLRKELDMLLRHLR